MSSRMLTSEGQSLAPPLAPELWNFSVLVLICGLVGWLMRLTQHFLTFTDVRFAVRSSAVLHLKDLGSSLSVLENATMWHFQQLSRTKLDVTSSKMASVHIPFEVAPSSLAVSRAAGSDAARPSDSPLPMHLSFKVRASAKCVVQVLWGVKTDALLEHSHRLVSASSLWSPRSPSLRDHIPVLRRLSSQQKSMRQRAADLPALLSRLRRQNRRHRLHDDRDDESDSTGARGRGDSSLAGLSLEHMLGEASFQSASPGTRFDTWGEHDFAAELPPSAAAGPVEEIRSLLDEVESDLPTNAVRPGPVSPGASPEPEPRYSAVVLIGALDFFDDASALGPKHVVHDDNDVVCQCIAIDFVPTPTRIEKVSPVIVKRFTVTLAGVYVQQEIFGRSDASGECVICLEGELAAVLLPCRHLCVCRACLREIDRCPICRATFSTYACFAEETVGACGDADSDSKAASVELKIV